MINKYTVFNRSGIIIPVDIEYPIDIYKHATGAEYTDFFDSSSKGVQWEFGNKQIVILNEDVDIFAYPTVDQQYVVAVYKGENSQFPMPNNTVIYNLDGSIHRVLQIPELLSPKLLENIQKEKHSNPPIEDNRYGHYGMGLQFIGFGWKKDKEGNLFNSISIQYAGEYGEWRVLNPESGTFGELVDDWYQSLGWR